MKKIEQPLVTLFLLIVSLLYLIFPITASAKEKFKIITTFTIIQDIAQNIAGKHAVVESITKPGAEIHDYQPTPHDIMKTQSADFIFWNGLNLERWFSRFLKDAKHIPSFVVTKGITPIPIENGHYNGHPNPHAWMSPNNALIYIDNIRKALIKFDPEHANSYNQNAKNYAAKIVALDKPLRLRLNNIPEEQRYLVTSEGAFSYLSRDYGFKEVYLWPINAEEQGTPQQVRYVIDTVMKYHIPVVFSESTVSDKPAKQVSKETGAKYGGVLYVDSLSTKNGPVPTYIDLLKTTVDTIAKGFNQ